MATKKKPAKKRTRPKATAKVRPGARRQPETLRLRDITPTFTATDLQRSMAFYRDVLGFVVGEEWRENGTLEGCEMLAGALCGSGTMRPERRGGATTTNGMLTIVIDPSRLVDRAGARSTRSRWTCRGANACS